MKAVLAIASLLIVLSTPFANAQETWNGLKFGMSVVKAKEMMKAKGVPMTAINLQTLQSLDDFNLQLLSGQGSYSVVVILQFGGAGLSKIILDLDLKECRKRDPELFSDAVTQYVFGKFSYEALLGKYGKPIAQENECTSTDSPDYGCSAVWRGNGQTIKLSTSGYPDRGALIQYEAQDSQL